MKRYFFLLLIVVLATLSSCKKEGGDPDGGVSCDLPSTTVSDDIVGDWANGYNSKTDIVDVYNGDYLGNNWQTGKVFHFAKDGKNAEFFITANAGFI